MPSTYILYSAQLDRYYVGYTDTSVEQRLQKHLTNHSGFTAKAQDWQVVWHQFFESGKDAAAYERKIKRWKSRKAIEKLIGA